MTKTLVLAEHDGTSLKDVTFELVGLAHQMSGGGAVEVLLLGSSVDSLATDLTKRGASRVHYVDQDAVSGYTSDGYLKGIEPALAHIDPDLVLIGNTPNGWDIAPLLAARLGVPLATGCSAGALEDGKAHFSRKAFNGKFVHKVAISDARPIMATVDKGAVAPYEGETDGTVEKMEVSIDPASLRSRYVETKKAPSSGLDLTQASVIVSGGRGVGEPEKLDVVRELASALGGQLGASRAVTDAGWLPHEHQIGSSGVTVSPKLYVACGISGAIQHVVGMKSSGYIVAINKDADAPIFGIADVGVVGDLFDIVPALTKAANES